MANYDNATLIELARYLLDDPSLVDEIMLCIERTHPVKAALRSGRK